MLDVRYLETSLNIIDIGTAFLLFIVIYIRNTRRFNILYIRDNAHKRYCFNQLLGEN